MVCLENCDHIVKLVMFLHITLNSKAELMSESGSADVPALLHVPRASPGESVFISLCAWMERLTCVRKTQYFQGSSCLAVSRSHWESEQGECARHHPGPQERGTSPDYLNCERVTQLFLPSFEFQQNIFPLC